MNSNFDAIVIGSGVIGTSVAFELAKSGKSVCVVDKSSAPGAGSTSASAAIVRFTYSTYESIALSWEAYHCWLNWQEHIGAPDKTGLVEFVQCGAGMANVPVMQTERTAKFFDEIGIDYELLEGHELDRIWPGIDSGKYWPPKRIEDPQFWDDTTEQITAIYTPQGGYISDPMQTAVNLADAAKRHGAVFKQNTKVIEILKEKGRILGIRTDKDEVILASVLVNVAGPWSPEVNKMAGAGSDFTITNRALRQEVHHVNWAKPTKPKPVFGDIDLGVYHRSDGANGLYIGGTEPECDAMHWVDDVDAAKMTPTMEIFEAQVTRAARRFPDLQVPNSASGIVGIYDASSDWAPIYDKSDVPGFYVAIGTSGNQFKNAPVVGRIMIEIINANESGDDTDANPIQFVGEHTGLSINTAIFSRKRQKNPNSSGTVMG